ncbi:hybrid sensor histidine kinase/response regulator [Abyssalbus ytuae]|uniref:histidine kinase n=1 Tax=Abyssalbus ytuae TaxID=2926907 RepID=A0A9E6ZYK1_9FLAO|nr:ATP-binding protein [Abyssalbus ytuae]UOB16251.1 ATP-binding protein [Abyssalbus ytuae]
MNSSKSRITLKVLLSYFVLALLAIIVGWLILSEIISFSETKKNDTAEKNKMLKVSKILTLMYESEGMARASLQTNSRETLDNYFIKNDTLAIEIDSLSALFENLSQQKLLDSVKILLDQKEKNILELRKISTDPSSEKTLQKAINDFSKFESSLGKLTIEEFVENPETLSETNRKNLEEYVAILNKYSPKTSSSNISQKTLDSIITASKTLLREIRSLSYRQKRNLSLKENELLQKELTISQTIRQILTSIEADIEIAAFQMNYEREQALSKSLNVIAIAAIIGAVLSIIFSILILNDFWKTQRYRKELEKAAQYSSSLLKSREQLISSVSHDLRTPLSTILGYTELLGNAALKEKEMYYVNNIKSASKYVSNLVDDLLNYSKLEAGKIKIETVPFKLKKIITETGESIKAINQKPIELIFEIDNIFEKELLGDPFRIREILTNLIGNAYKFTQKGYIKITANSTFKDDNTLLATITVEDTGIGIKKEKQELIFKEFTQAEDDTEKKYGGAGLGLTISKKLAQLLNGDLLLKSKENIGSKFILQIPLQTSNTKYITNDKEEKLNFLQYNFQIVVVDDDPVLLELNSTVLKQHGIKVTSFKNASDALEKLHSLSYNLIITDIQMPVMNGFRFLEILKTKKEHAYKNQPVVAVTGRHDLEKSHYLKAGFSEVVYKPYTPDDLLLVIEKIFNTQSVIKNGFDNKKEPPFYNALFNLTPLRKMLDNDEEAVQQIIETFILNTNAELQKMHFYIKEKKIQNVKEGAHKMISMFRQIEARNVVEILDKLEHIDLKSDNKNIESQFKKLKKRIHAVFNALETNTVA